MPLSVTDPPPLLTTPRLRLRELEKRDLNDVTRIVGDFNVSKWLVPVPHPYSFDNAAHFFNEVKAGDLGLVWAIEFETAFVGVIGVGPSLGYWLCPSVWGRGLMSEAVQPVIDVWFRDVGEATLPSCYFVGNVGSQRVLEKAGFVATGRGRVFSCARDEDVETQNMLLTRERVLTLRNPVIPRSQL